MCLAIISQVTSGCSPHQKFAIGPNLPTPSVHISSPPTSSVSTAVVKGSSHDHPVSPVGATESLPVLLFFYVFTLHKGSLGFYFSPQFVLARSC